MPHKNKEKALEYNREWKKQDRIKNPERYTSRYDYNQKFARERMERRRYWLNKYKIARGCDICGFKEHPVALEFDHRDIYSKVFTIGKAMVYPLKRLFDEIRKCNLVCSNHHRILTFNNRKQIQEKRKASVASKSKKEINKTP